jgi:uncharacterized protein (TIGR02680 family)
MTQTVLAPLRPLPEHPGRFRLSRAGIHQVWQYDQTFVFGAGRLLLRGKNGAGKSKALEVLLPFLLDGDPRRIDSTGSGKTTLRWLMLDGWTGGTNRLGYLWLEFTRVDDEGRTGRLTVGAAIKASTSTGDAKATYFVTPLSAVDDLALSDPRNRPGIDRLRELVRPENCFERPTEYRARVARDLFGITDLGRYRNLVHLLHGLRRPTIGDRIEAGELAKVLTEGLPPLDDDVIDEVARNLDDLDAVRAELARLERTETALTTFLTGYRGYLRGVLRGRVTVVRGALEELGRRRRAAGDADRLFARCRQAETVARTEVGRWERALGDADADLRALRNSAAYHALDDLRARRQTVDAMTETARGAWQAAELARTSERNVAERLGTDTEDLGAELTALGEAARDAAGRARSCGLADSLIDHPPAPVRAVLATPHVDTLTGLDGRPVEVSRPAAHIVEPATGQALTTWRGRLVEVDTVAGTRQRAVTVLRDGLKELATKEAEAGRLGQDVDRLEEDLTGARRTERDRGEDLMRTSTEYADGVRRWASAMSEVDTGPVLALVEFPADDDSPVADRAADRELPHAVRDAAHELVDPMLSTLDELRDGVVARQRLIADDLAEVGREKHRWEEQTDPERPVSPYATGDRDPRTGAPLYLLVDFAEDADPARRAGLEAALQASGLLGGWVCADGVVLAADTEDVLLRPAAPVAGPSLADALRPALPDGCPVTEATVRLLLGGIGLGESDAAGWVGSDGRWRLGVAHGAYHKASADYVGSGARAAARARRIAELGRRADVLGKELAAVTAERKTIERRRHDLGAALRRIPDGHALTAAWTGYDTAVKATGTVTERLAKARRLVEEARTTVSRLRGRLAAQAGADGLPFDAEELVVLRGELGRLRAELSTLTTGAERLATRIVRLSRTAEEWSQAQRARTDLERAYRDAHDTLTDAARELRTLEDSVGASEQEVLAREQNAERRRGEAIGALPDVRNARDAAHDETIRAELARDAAAEGLAEQERHTVASGGQLRRPLGMPGLALAAELGEMGGALTEFDTVQTGGARTRIAALRALAEDIAGRLGPAGADIGDSAILRRGEELRDGLAGGFDAAVDEVDGIKRFELHDDIGAHDVAVVGQRIRTAAADARQRLSAREQEVFERYLLGELGDHLTRQVLAAENLVAAMNQTLDQVRSSHGIGARLVWSLPPDADADVKAAVTLLRQPSALRTREQSEQLRAALRGRIEVHRQADPSAGYGVHLRAALDYRSWFAFTVRVTDAARPDRERVLSHRTALSQGEQRVVSYVVLFAAAAAHFTTLGRSAPAAPRLILLDDAFAKVDEPTHGNLLGLLVDLDLDFICTSERLWGCFATVPSLHIYECLRDPTRRGVATVHYTWDGHRKRLLSV